MREELQTGVLVRKVGSQLGGVWGGLPPEIWELGVVSSTVPCSLGGTALALLKKLRKSVQSVVAWIKYSLLLSCAESQP